MVNSQMFLRHTVVRFGLGLALLSCFFAKIAAVDAQAPEITNPEDLNYLDVNTAFDTAASDPSWTVKAPMPTARAGFSIAAANDGVSDKIYVIGGATLLNCTQIDVVEAYDPATDSWSTVEPIPDPPRWRPFAATLGNIIYVVGGAETGCTGKALGIVQAYDPTALTNPWSTKTPLNHPRLQLGLGVDPLNNLLYAVGGTSGYPDFAPVTTVEVYDPTTDQWHDISDLGTARGLPAVVVVEGKVYAVGGQAGNRAIRSAEVYDPATGMWTPTSSIEPDPPRLNPGAAVLDDKLYIAGGQLVGDLSAPLSAVNSYDPATDSWTTEPSLPTARLAPGVAAVGTVLYAIGGQAPIGRVGAQFTYQITATNSPDYFDAAPLPDGLTIDHTRGIISGIPTTTISSFLVTFSATNGSGTSNKVVSFYIAPAPAGPGVPDIVSSTCATARAGAPFGFQVLTNNASSEAQLAATGLPYQEGQGAELTIDPGTGLISGTVPPTLDGAAQSFGVALGLADVSASAQSFLELTFVTDPTLPVITSSSNATLVLNRFFSYQITADAIAPYLDYIGLNGKLDGTLPPGLSFDGASGTISGIFTGDTAANSRAKSAHPGQGADGSSDENGIETTDTIKKEPPPHLQLLAGNNAGGTGTAPLNFIIGLHDLEIEALTNTTSEDTGYVIFTDDPLTSGGAAGLLEATKVGDSVTYTVPITVAGTYDVKIGIKTNNNEGVFQLAIDGVNQGSPQDAYSVTVGYDVRDLGPVTFTSAGNKSFQFLVTGQNPQSSGYELVFDYLDLDPYFEAEALSVVANSAPYVTIHNPNLSGSTATRFEATQAGDYLTYTVPIAMPGIYHVSLGTKTSRDEGIFQLFVEGVNQGYAQNEFSPTVTYGVRDLGTVKFATAGAKAFQFLVTGRDPRSKGYELVFDYIDLVLATQLEAEALPARATARLVPVNDPNLSGPPGDAGTLLNAKAVGDYVNYKVPIPVAGTYDIKLGIRTGNKSGIFQLSIDGVNQGSAQDEYSGRVGYEVLDLGKVTFTEAGNKAFKFLVTDHNPNSAGYQLIFDYIDLVR